MPRLQVLIPDELYEAIERQAKSELSTISHVARRALRDVFLPDQATVERCLAQRREWEKELPDA